MARLISATFVLAAAVLLLAVACTDETTIIQPVEGEAVRLSGVVYAWDCNRPADTTIPWHESMRFHAQTGEPATIRLVRDNGFWSEFTTDSLSEFNRYISAGSYMAIVNTGFTWPPDTFYNIHLTPGDTSISFHIQLQVLDPDTIYFAFHYPALTDRLPSREELQTIYRVSRLAHIPNEDGPLVLSHQPLPPDSFLHSIQCRTWGDSSCWVTYYVPVMRRSTRGAALWNVIEADLAIREAAAADTTGVVPGNLTFAAAGYYICHFGEAEGVGGPSKDSGHSVY